MIYLQHLSPPPKKRLILCKNTEKGNLGNYCVLDLASSGRQVVGIVLERGQKENREGQVCLEFMLSYRGPKEESEGKTY